MRILNFRFIRQLTVISLSVMATGVCGQVFNSTTGNYYEKVTAQGGWPRQFQRAAIKSFAGRQGRLATIETQQENEFVTSQVSSGNTSLYALGGFQNYWSPGFTEPQSGWRWINGATIGFTNWFQPAEPNNLGGNEEYLIFDHQPGRWNDISGTRTLLGAIIEYDKQLLSSLNQNLIWNGGFEEGSFLTNQAGFSGYSLQDWVMYGDGNANLYSERIPPLEVPSTDVGNRFAVAGYAANTNCFQYVNLTPFRSIIDAGIGQYDFSALLGGLGTSNDRAWIQVRFVGISNNALTGWISVAAVTAAERENVSKLIERNLVGIIPAGARMAQVMVSSVRADGSFNSALFDNVRFSLSQVPTPVIASTINLSDTNGVDGEESIGWSLSNGVQTFSGTFYPADRGSTEFLIPYPSGAPDGSYVLRIKGGSFLAKSVPVSLTGGSLTVPQITLINGDIDQDGEVGPSDFELVVAQFGGIGNADADNDGEVGPSDFEIVVENFGLQDE